MTTFEQSDLDDVVERNHPDNESIIGALADDLVAMADWLRANAATCPDVSLVPPPRPLTLLSIGCMGLYDDAVTAAVELAAATRWLGTANKVGSDDYMRVRRTFGNLAIEAWAERGDVCEQVEVGTKEVVTPDETSPQYHQWIAARDRLAEMEAEIPAVTAVEPVFEWDCKPILGGADR